MVKKQFILLFILFAMTGCSRSLPSFNEIIGEYKSDSGNEQISLHSDNTFTFAWKTNGEEGKKTTGTFVLEMTIDKPTVTLNGLSIIRLNDHKSFYFSPSRAFMPLYIDEKRGNYTLVFWDEVNPVILYKK